MRIIFTISSLIFLALYSIAQDSQNVTLLDHWKNDTLVPSAAHINTYNETWGFIQDGVEYGVIGSTWGTHIFNLSDPSNIYEAGSFKGEYFGPGVIHRDYHDYNGYLYAVCDEGWGDSKLRIVDLQYLPDSVHTVYLEDSLFTTSHNIFIDTATAKLYTCGGNSNPGIRVFSLANPEIPVEISSLPLPTYSHDIFVRNDTAYINDGTYGLYIYNFSNSANPTLIGSLEQYPQQGYNHSGWLTEDGSVYVMADETHGKDIKILDVSDLGNITILDTISSQIDNPFTIPHNIMVSNNNAYVSYYFDGFVVYNISDPSNPYISGYYDTSTETHADGVYRGCWGIYSFFPSGIVLASDMQNGLYVFDVSNATGIEVTENQKAEFVVFPNPTTDRVIISSKYLTGASYKIFDLNGKCILSGIFNSSIESIDLSNQPNGSYFIDIYSVHGFVQTQKLVKSN